MMTFTIFAEDAELWVLEYTVTMNASYSEIEDASKGENFIAWVVANAIEIKCSLMGDFTSNDFLETILWNGDKQLSTYYVVSGDSIKLLPKYPEDDQ